jgi:hypothetical protein
MKCSGFFFTEQPALVWRPARRANSIGSTYGLWPEVVEAPDGKEDQG